MFSETTFINSLQNTIPTYTNGVNLQVIIKAGATNIRAIITNLNTLASVLVAYSKSIN